MQHAAIGDSGAPTRRLSGTPRPQVSCSKSMSGSDPIPAMGPCPVRDGGFFGGTRTRRSGSGIASSKTTPRVPILYIVYDYLLKHYVETDPEKAEALARECLVKEEFHGRQEAQELRLPGLVRSLLEGRRRSEGSTNWCRNSWNRDIRIRWLIRTSPTTTQKRDR